MFIFWNRIIKIDATKLTKKVFETDYRICKITGVQKSNNILKNKIRLIFIIANIHVIYMKCEIVCIRYLLINGLMMYN